MFKRTLITMILLICLLSIAAADGIPLSTDILPPCYQEARYGLNLVYADGPVPVYSSQSMNGPAADYVHPYQIVQVEEIDKDAGLVYICYNGNEQGDTLTYDTNSPRGWVEDRYVTCSCYADTAYLWVITTDKPGNRLHLRTRPAADSISLGKFYAGTIVRQLEEPRNGYMKVGIGDLVGYMDTRFLAYGIYTPTAELPLLTVIQPEGLYLHRTAMPNSKTIQYVPCGEVVTALSVRDDEMIQVLYDNNIGYIHYSLADPKLTY